MGARVVAVSEGRDGSSVRRCRPAATAPGRELGDGRGLASLRCLSDGEGRQNRCRGWERLSARTGGRNRRRPRQGDRRRVPPCGGDDGRTSGDTGPAVGIVEEREEQGDHPGAPRPDTGAGVPQGGRVGARRFPRAVARTSAGAAAAPPVAVLGWPVGRRDPRRAAARRHVGLQGAVTRDRPHVRWPRADAGLRGCRMM